MKLSNGNPNPSAARVADPIDLDHLDSILRDSFEHELYTVTERLLVKWDELSDREKSPAAGNAACS